MIVFQYKINELYRKYESYGVSLFRFFKMQAALYLSYFCDCEVKILSPVCRAHGSVDVGGDV